jgi:hypothetical protein
VGTPVFPRGQSGRGPKLTHDLRPVPGLRIGGAVTHITIRPRGMHFTFCYQGRSEDQPEARVWQNLSTGTEKCRCLASSWFEVCLATEVWVLLAFYKSRTAYCVLRTAYFTSFK